MGILVVAVLAIAYGTQAPSLGVAEFAPAAKQALEAPPTTATESVSASRQGGRRSTPTTAPASTTAMPADSGGAPSAPTTRVSRSRTCVGQPPRQIEDPMSPPCLATIFEGDNGGATATGVTQTEIAVAIPHDGWCTPTAQCQQFVNAMFEFFNQRFEFYGRRLRPVFVASSDNNPVSARAMASTIASQQVFATLTSLVEWNDASAALFQELGRQRVVAIMRGFQVSDRLLLDDLHPYLWAAQPSTEQWQRNVADFACTSLAGGLARFAGSTGLQSQTRKFGVVVAGGFATPPEHDMFAGLEACGIRPEVFRWTEASSSPAELRAGFERFRASGVTTVACLCVSWFWQHVTGGLSALADYRPEVLMPVSNHSTQEEIGSLRAMGNSVFGITAQPKVLPTQALSWYQAVVSVNPQLLVGAGWDGFGVSRMMYEGLLILASGIQGAGPSLTPETFAAGLMATQFSNSGAGQAPYWQPSVGFGPGDHSFFSDYAITWWSETAPAVEPESARPTGSWCYVGQGARYRVGTYPKDVEHQLFNRELPCR